MIIPFSEIMRANLRSVGLPVNVLEFDWSGTLHYLPDLVIELNGSQSKNFTSPIVRWKFDDGRKFSSRPTPRVAKQEHNWFILHWETADWGSQPMIEEIMRLIRESFDRSSLVNP